MEGHFVHLFQVVIISDFPLLPAGIEQGGDGAFFPVPVLAVVSEVAIVRAVQLLLGLLREGGEPRILQIFHEGLLGRFRIRLQPIQDVAEGLIAVNQRLLRGSVLPAITHSASQYVLVVGDNILLQFSHGGLIHQCHDGTSLSVR